MSKYDKELPFSLRGSYSLLFWIGLNCFFCLL
ncbi:hypothetical protein CUMW_121590 [Citrus unshiu]|nr:hypothetical protein CUMW_121590 [Citrus unshiu]